jgi:hypothetical protein
MLTKLNIPGTLKVGFQNRRDTYTGKLAYIVYKDANGVLKQEKSWRGWCDQRIPSVEFDNEPTEGFVLNKKVGGGGGWSRRDTWARVYDPRGFEFEISIPNLFFILEECSAIKGKGLEGEFVYAWDRAKLVLLPVTSQEYASSLEHTTLQNKTITQDDMEEGCIYKTKEGKAVIYLGKHPWYYTHRKWNYHTYTQGPPKQHYTKKHIFVSLDGTRYGFKGETTCYLVQANFDKLAERLSQEPSMEYAAAFEEFKTSRHGQKPEKAKV